MRRQRLAAAVLATAGLVALPVSATAGSDTYTLDLPVTAGGPSPFGGCSFGGPGTVYPDTELEPFIAVNPTEPDNLIGVFQQDRWRDGGAHGLVASYSMDGGQSWDRSFAEFSQCADDGDAGYASPFPRASDPWVSFDSAGRAYQISLGVDSANLNFSGIEASTSVDGGATWGTPVRLITDNNAVNFNDKESITADWRPGVGAGKAYATWIRGDLPGWDNLNLTGALNSFAYTGRPMFAMTSDGGHTWTEPKPMIKSIVYVQGNQIAVLPDGTLVNIGAMLFRGSGVQPTSQQYFWTTLVSTNGGKTWGAPNKVAPLGTVLLTNPDIPNPKTLDETIRAGDYLPDVAVDRATGAIYMTFADGVGTGFNHVKLTKSTDGGRHWTTPVDVTSTPSTTHSFNGTVEVTDDGTVAVLYYDFRDNTPDPGLPTDVWLTHSHDGGQTWTEQHVYGSFDMENAPVARGWFLGDYQGLSAAGDDLMAFFSVSTDAPNSANVIAVRARSTP
jgi:hypothetical protein